ncbi:MAG: DNA-directed RNA polymerase subunit M [Lachnospiraceae bacterium]|nr:DNA-directed RNA polymerase subunit M [Lachnospiraceae bacterium]
MIRLFICPKCGWVRTVSRKSNVECFKCEDVRMIPSKLEYAKFVEMSEQERRDYVDSWMYIHKNNKDAVV